MPRIDRSRSDDMTFALGQKMADLHMALDAANALFIEVFHSTAELVDQIGKEDEDAEARESGSPGSSAGEEDSRHEGSRQVH